MKLFEGEIKLLSRPYRFFTRVELLIGSEQVDTTVAKASDDLRYYFKEPESPTAGELSEIGIMSYNFPKREWNDSFCQWLRELSERNIKIKLLGGPI